MASNYSEDQVSMMIEKYSANPSRDTVDELADILNKSVKSIIGKLSREGVYQKAIYKTKTGELPITKAQLIVKISEIIDCSPDIIMGLEKAPKQDLKFLLVRLERLTTEEEIT